MDPKKEIDLINQTFEGVLKAVLPGGDAKQILENPSNDQLSQIVQLMNANGENKFYELDRKSKDSIMSLVKERMKGKFRND
jgi:hypothetical protein